MENQFIAKNSKRSRAWRRHQNERCETKAFNIIHGWFAMHPDKTIDDIKNQAKIYADNLQSCSCFTCGNPRFHFNQSSLQEKSFKIRFANELSDLKIF